MRTRLATLLVIAGALALPGCTKFHAKAPEGFAAYDDSSPFRAVSPDGVVFRVRVEDNEPEARLPFWREALKKRMLDAGYAFLSDGEIKGGPETGYRLELAAPVGQQDYAYLVALFDRGSHFVIVESSGEVTRFKARRDAVVAAIAAMTF